MTRAEAPDVARDSLLRVLDALDTGLLVIDEDRRIVAINDALAKGWGVAAEAVVGTPLGDVFEPETERWYLPERGSKGEPGRSPRCGPVPGRRAPPGRLLHPSCRGRPR